jgi:hypothetical protein
MGSKKNQNDNFPETAPASFTKFQKFMETIFLDKTIQAVSSGKLQYAQ